MALTNIETVFKQLPPLLEKLEVSQTIEILSYKRNRGISLRRLDRDRFLVRERGYVEEESEWPSEELPRKLRAMLKREFPRSRKLRIYHLAAGEEPDRPRKKL